MAVSLFLGWAQCCSINSTHLNPALYTTRPRRCLGGGRAAMSGYGQRQPTTPAAAAAAVMVVDVALTK